MANFEHHNHKWELDTPYAKGHRQALGGLKPMYQQLTTATRDEYNAEYQEGYEAGNRERLENLLKKGL